MPPMSYEQYPSPPMLISNHVSPISAQVYPQSYQATIPMYPSAFVPQVQYGTPIMPMVQVNAPMMSFGGQPVTYATYPSPIQANPIYNMPPGPQVVKDSANKINMNPHQYHHNRHHNDHHQQQQEYCAPVRLPQQHAPMPVQQPQPVIPANIQQSAANSNERVAKASQIQSQPQAQPVQQQVQVQQQQSAPITNGPVRNPSPIEPANNKVVSPSTNQIPPVVTNGHDAVPVQANGIGSNAASPTNTETISAPSETQISPSTMSDNAAPANNSTASTETNASSGSAGMSWAGLFNKKNNTDHSERVETKNQNNLNSINALPSNNNTESVTVVEENRKKSPLAEIRDPNYYRMGGK